MPRSLRGPSLLALAGVMILAAPARSQQPSAALDAAPGRAGPLLPAVPAAPLPSPLTASDRFAAPVRVRALDPEQLSPPHPYYSYPLALVLGTGGMMAGYGLGLGPFGCEDESPGCSTGPDDFEYVLAYSGLVLGSAAGAHWGGKRRDSRGSFWPTVGGAALGGLAILVMPRDDDQTGAWVGSMLAAPAGAAIMDALVRRPRNR